MTDKKPDVFMPLYIGDYLAGTSRLTTEQHGAYLLLIMDYWMNGPMPDNNQVLASICKCSIDAWSIHRALLEKFFSIENGEWKHKRIEQELENARSRKQGAKAKAEKAAAARWGKQGKTEKECSPDPSSNAPSITQELHEECPSPSPSPSYIESKDSIKPLDASTSDAPMDIGIESAKISKPKPDYPLWFETLWKRYPPRSGANDKRKALHAVNARMKSGKTIEQLTNAVERYAQFLRMNGNWGTQYVMQGATFFGPGGHVDNDWSFSHAADNRSGFKPNQSAGLDANDTSWIDPLFGPSSVGGGAGESHIPPIEGDFSRLESGDVDG